MNSDRIKEIQETTAYPESVSVKQALLQVWNECQQEQVKNCSIPVVVGQSEQLKAVEELVDFARDVTNVCDLDRLEEILDRL
jgi:hypothetical protein